MAAALNIALLIFVLSNVKKQSLAGSNWVCYSFNGEEVTDSCNSRITTSLWVYKRERGIRLCQHPHSGLSLLLILAGDVELWTGPSVKCFTCNKTIRKNKSLEKCFHCERNCHLNKKKLWHMQSDHDLVGMIMKKNNRKFKSRTIYTRNFAKYNEAAWLQEGST